MTGVGLHKKMEENAGLLIFRHPGGLIHWRPGTDNP